MKLSYMFIIQLTIHFNEIVIEVLILNFKILKSKGEAW